MSPSVEFSKTAPSDLARPDWLEHQVKRVTGGETDYILDHGFSRDTIKPQWWKDAANVDLRFEGGQSGDLLTRGQIFSMANEFDPDDSDRLLDFLWHVLAWGSGSSRRQNSRRIESASASENIERLGESFTDARDGRVREAYARLVQPGKATIPYLGPAFFTKFLYFTSSGVESRSLILDARVARSLYDLGWSTGRNYPSKTFSYNWYTDTYVSYCELLAGWAKKLGTEPDVIERILFEGAPEEIDPDPED